MSAFHNASYSPGGLKPFLRFLPIIPSLTVVLTTLVISFFSTSLLAQEVEVIQDTVVEKTNDSTIISSRGKIINIKSYAKRFKPRKALLYSAIFPGAGQIYNKKYWKLPIVYGGFIALALGASFYNDGYFKYRAELIGFTNNPAFPTTNGFTEVQLRTVVDNYRRQRDFFIVLGGFMYILQIVDAHVDAHLKEFDLNPQLKVSLEPSTQQNGLIGRSSGFTLTLKF